ncbi:uncharacterized protein EI90DRAFT_3131116 [Cantharellus anzutake]|uniref:uncharacterized protein n=1 Tax=Cantharellus anzutake TaxID=1750568 RepID=UPI001903EA89|nr:uncharacterized protein EI90DRAFT_3131116 [Cantharellus anzutake]KAF8322314.1 hypothetical protein EI90DRAFT_3131116 [Cantharellus anzutake]
MEEDIDCEEIRRRNIAQNEALLASLDLKDASHSPGMLPVKSAKSRISEKIDRVRPVRPRKVEKARKENTSVPRRQSSRLAHLHASPDDTPIQRLVSVVEKLETKRKREEVERLAVLELERVARRPRHGNLSLDDLVGDEDDTKESISSLRDTLETACNDVHSVETRLRNSRNIAEKPQLRGSDPDINDLRKRLGSMVVRSRAKLGIWDALAPSEENEEDKYDDTRGGRYWRLQPHWPRSPKTSISCIKFSPTDAHSVLTTSYDSMLRVTSFTSGQSAELFSLASASTLLTSFDIAPCGNEIWISDTDGGLSFLDLREGNRLRRQVNAKLKIGCVSINPAAGRRSALDLTSCRTWDVRKLMLIETGALVEGDDDGSSSLKVKPPPVLEADHEAVADFLSSKSGRGCILGQFEHKHSVGWMDHSLDIIAYNGEEIGKLADRSK